MRDMIVKATMLMEACPQVPMGQGCRSLRASSRCLQSARLPSSSSSLSSSFKNVGRRYISRPPSCSATSETKNVSVAKRRKLGKSDLETSEMGIGAWSWGDRSGYWQGWTKEGSLEAYKAALSYGMTHIDTAEVYGNGLSEEFVGEFMRMTGTADQVEIATKFAPLPWRQTPGSLVSACEASLRRLGIAKMGLYMQHWPGFLFNTFSNDAYLEGLLMVWEKGMAEAIGVSNFNAERVKNAARKFEARGTCLASNQVQYSLLYRAPENNGVLEACQEYGTTLVAYSPLCQGLLSGRYSKENPPSGPRRFIFTNERYSSVFTLLDLMKKIGEENGGKTSAQVALNWTLCKDVLPIPGARNAKQVDELAGALGWRMSDGEVEELDRLSAKLPSSLGAPFEKW